MKLLIFSGIIARDLGLAFLILYLYFGITNPIVMRSSLFTNKSFSLVRALRGLVEQVLSQFDTPEQQQFRRLKKMVG